MRAVKDDKVSDTDAGKYDKTAFLSMVKCEARQMILNQFVIYASSLITNRSFKW